MKLLMVQRRNAIKAMLLERGSITIDEVIAKFDISVETARRDFDALADEGFLNKVYGGATLKKRTSAMPSRDLLVHNFSEGKARMARRAVRFLKNGDTIFLDNSDTVFHMCEGLASMELTVITNSLQVINALAPSKSINLISVGGRYISGADSFLGPNASEFMRRFQVDRAFITCRSFDEQHGLGSSDEMIGDFKHTVMQCAEQVLLLADHSKFGKVSFFHFADLDDVDILFTDELISDEWKETLSNHGVRYFECPESGDVQQEEHFY